MLQTHTVEPGTLEILKCIQNKESLNDFVLCGGTGLALVLGHRVSIDLDFFSNDRSNIELVQSEIDTIGKVLVENRTKKILQLYIDSIKVDFISTDYKWIKDYQKLEGTRIASLPDIAAMKLLAVTNRGSKKDFIDLYYLLKEFSIQEMISFYTIKYPEESIMQLLRSLSYFKDAESQPMPKVFDDISWRHIREILIQKTQDYFNS